ncbi:hypothetical protein FIBSPDRAFT_1047558 [Athelia psychrophila]|uniref:Uncharacterized protein n=1 Tax=Athelia psychrophila TaxID=1759441 RepID=A0A166F0L0_9AGAM|nr:hypothetical protein FIBSPDRAFT_1047558 [Fibularhizoctonia sp. CBS 109695]
MSSACAAPHLNSLLIKHVIFAAVATNNYKGLSLSDLISREEPFDAQLHVYISSSMHQKLAPLAQQVASSSNIFHPPATHLSQYEENATSFEAMSQSLSLIGALTIEHYLHASVELNELDVPYYLRETHETPPAVAVVSQPQGISLKGEDAQSKTKTENKTRKQLKANTNPETEAKAKANAQCIVQLHQTCQKVFGKTDPLKFEFNDLEGPSSKRCTLTITHPSGGQRTYTTPGVFARKNEAKAQTAALAMSMGALEFILTGNTDAKVIQGKPNGVLVLAPLDAPTEVTVEAVAEDSLLREIEQACVRWGVKPYWVALIENGKREKTGCALRIQISPHPRHVRVYTSPAEQETLAAAKADCARVAYDQGVLDFIKQGNAAMNTGVAKSEFKNEIVTPLILQEFYDAFPHPFPESFGVSPDNKPLSLGEFSASSWLNTTLQSARGAKLTTTFTWTTNVTGFGGTLGLHGCLLRIDRPGESRLYLGDARFVKRADAKAAACLQAMFQGVGPYIRGLGQDLDGKLTPRMKRWANELILPTLDAECTKVPRTDLQFVYEQDVDAFGCTMVLAFPTPPPLPSHARARAGEMIERRYIVPAEYRTKVDAKCAVACRATEQGAIEFLRFRGGPVPPYYQTFHSELVRGTLSIPQETTNGNTKKRKSGIEQGGREIKRHLHYQPQPDDNRTRDSDAWNQQHRIGRPSAMATTRGEPISWNSNESNSFHHANSVPSSSALNPVRSNFAGPSTLPRVQGLPDRPSMPLPPAPPRPPQYIPYAPPPLPRNAPPPPPPGMHQHFPGHDMYRNFTTPHLGLPPFGFSHPPPHTPLHSQAGLIHPPAHFHGNNYVAGPPPPPHGSHPGVPF